MSRLGNQLFQFAVVGDTHIEPDGDPVPRSNARTLKIIDAVQHASPGFVIHLGDVVHPLPAMDESSRAVETAQRMLSRLTCDVWYVAGNHDVGDKPLPMMPASKARRQWIDLWESKFSPQRCFFAHSGCKFIIFNSPILNSNDDENREQLAWLENALTSAPDCRAFVATHYPLFLLDPDEAGHYDNVDNPARSRLLELFQKYRVEAVFTGHIHNWFYHRLGATEFYSAPSTSFIRRDFSELFRVASLSEYGRDDPQKLGYLWVNVHKNGHVVRFMSLADLGSSPAALRAPGHPKDGKWSGLGVNLRHPWCEIVKFPFNPPTDAFARKTVREDYTVRMLCEMGLHDLRVPLDDLHDDRTYARMQDLVILGFRFVAFRAGPLSPHDREVLRKRGGLLDALEVIHLPEQRSAIVEEVAALAVDAPYALWLNELRRPETIKKGSLSLRVTHGYDISDGKTVNKAVRELMRVPGRRGLVFNSPISTFSADYAFGVRELLNGLGVEAATLLTREASDMLALQDEAKLVPELERALQVAVEFPEQRFIFDTFMEMDRSYHVRIGLIDRRANATAAGEVLRRRHSIVLAGRRGAR